ncbi:MAG TPA: hypothetical protein VMR97_09860 [Acidimicrobiales bacterium]|nr:hypothetical protein [Acidimicrobiales bacterium]
MTQEGQDASQGPGPKEFSQGPGPKEFSQGLEPQEFPQSPAPQGFSQGLEEAQGEATFDLVAAQLRADAADTDTFFEVLASKLSGALGDRVRLERSGGLLKRERPVTGMELDLTSGDAGMMLSARRERGGAVACIVARKVRGIVLSSRQVPMSQWVEELLAALGDEARRSEQTWKALNGLLT